MADQAKDKHEDLKKKLADLFRKSGHVAEEGVEALAETAATVLLAGKFGE